MSPSHEHSVQVACIWNDEGECFTRYACFDPTCDWCVTELTGPITGLVHGGLTSDPIFDAIQQAIFRERASAPSGLAGTGGAIQSEFFATAPKAPGET